ncbi:MAG: DNA polymerase I [Desulfobacteraceae bacterium]|nr:MAG: DNA polymerase I [Desulfobacteraceae bacterium]
MPEPTNSPKTVYLIDGTAYIHRAYHAIRSLATSKGFPSNAVFGFARMLIKLMDDKSPEFVAMFFDSRGPTFRHDIYPDYKANRPPMNEDMAVQIPYIKELTAGFNIPIFELPGYEADDLIGTVAKRSAAEGFDVVMVTGDKDFMQLITDRITIWDPMKDEAINRGTVLAKHGLEPLQMLDVLGLAGDASDNIPGVPGIGPKTAMALLQTFGSMDGIYENIDRITSKAQKEKLLAHKDQAILSRELATINTHSPIDIDVPSFRVTGPDNARLAKIFQELEFRQLQKDFPVESDLSGKQYHAVLDEASLSGLIRTLSEATAFAVDTETTSVDPMTATLVGLSFAVKPHEAFYIPCGHDYAGAPAQMDTADVLKRLKPVLENPEIHKIGQNIKYDWAVLRRHGADLKGVAFDTMIASYLINPEKRAHNLDQIARDFLDHHMISYEQAVTGEDGKKQNFSQVEIERAVPYSCEDADITLMASEKFTPLLAAQNLTRLFETVEMPLVPVLMRMEMTGIRVDKDRLFETSKHLSQQLEQIEQQIYSVAGEEFNIQSPQQMGVILFDKLKLPVQKKTKKKTAYSTDVDVLTTLADLHEMPALVLRHRTLSKLKSTYVDALFELVNPETGRVHTSFNQTITATGRLSSSNPNLQNIPIRTEEGREVRRAFIPKDGWSFVSMDYSQIELRLLAHYSGDEILIDAFQKDEDIHTRTAAEVFQALPGMITNDLRQQAKVINFGIMYGMSAFSLSKELRISQKMAKTYIDNYFSRYSGVRQFIDATIEASRQTGMTSTELGRIRFLPDINSQNANMRGFAERNAVNTKIQGTAADLIKLAMVRVDEALMKNGLKSAMLLSVHDELVFEVPPEEMDTVKKLAADIMENVWDLKVPLKVSVSEGKDWADAH